MTPGPPRSLRRPVLRRSSRPPRPRRRRPRKSRPLHRPVSRHRPERKARRVRRDPRPGGSHDVVLLEGPQSRLQDLVTLVRAMWDFVRGFRALHFVGPCVTIFRIGALQRIASALRHRREVGRRVSGLGFTVMTGGGPGLMEAANRGARDVGGLSVGCNIELPFEQDPEPVSRSLDHLPLLLRAQGPAVQVFVHVRRAARRPRHARRALRGADADSDKEDPGVSRSS